MRITKTVLSAVIAVSVITLTGCGTIERNYNYPVAHKDIFAIDDYHGTLVADPYRWLEDADVAVPRDAHGQPVHPIEISPLYALDASELADRLPRECRLDGPLYLAPERNAMK